MIVLMLILWLLFSVALLLVTAIRPLRSKHSIFELKRLGDDAVINRERLLGDIYALRRALAVVLVMIVTIVGWSQWQGMGIIVVLAALALMVSLSHWAPVERSAMHLYESNEVALLGFVSRWPLLGRLFGSNRRLTHDQRLESQEHLVHLVESAGHVLTTKQQDLIKRSLRWHSTTIKEIMTAAADIVSVSKHEMLGPLVLNDLHKSGHHTFPVIQGSIDHILGMVTITDLLKVDAVQKSLTAEKAMIPIEVRLSADTELSDALEQLSTHPGQLGLVVDDNKTIGLVTQRDILKALLG